MPPDALKIRSNRIEPFYLSLVWFGLLYHRVTLVGCHVAPEHRLQRPDTPSERLAIQRQARETLLTACLDCCLTLLFREHGNLPEVLAFTQTTDFLFCAIIATRSADSSPALDDIEFVASIAFLANYSTILEGLLLERVCECKSRSPIEKTIVAPHSESLDTHPAVPWPSAWQGP